jgi:hypothetical protein
MISMTALELPITPIWFIFNLDAEMEPLIHTDCHPKRHVSEAGACDSNGAKRNGSRRHFSKEIEPEARFNPQRILKNSLFTHKDNKEAGTDFFDRIDRMGIL